VNAKQFFAELQTLDLQNPGTMPRWAHFVITAFAAVAILVAGSYTLIKPEYEALDAEQQKEQTLRGDFEKKQKKVAALDAYKAQLETMEHDFGAMLRQLPSKTEVENLLNDISQTRVASSLEEELFQPQPEIPKEFYAEVPHKIVVTGQYHEMGAFVAGVAALPRIVTIDEVEIKPVATGPGAQINRGKGALRMSALAKTYRYLDANEIAAANDAKKPKAGAKK
jgi:type IV pilus assembly protein PilO